MEQKHFGTLMYPSDMDAEHWSVDAHGSRTSEGHYFPEAIKFTFYEREGLNFENMQNNVAKNTTITRAFTANEKDIRRDTLGAVGAGVAGSFIHEDVAKLFPTNRFVVAETLANIDSNDNANSESSKETNKNRNIIDSALTGLRRIQKINATQREVGNVYLHMPNNITLNEEAAWGGESLGVVGALTKSGLKTGRGDVVATLVGGALGQTGNIIAATGGGILGSVLSKIPGVSGWTGGLIGAIGGGVIQRGAQAAFSVSRNPYMEMMFTGIGFRTFKFDFIFRARNKSEIKTVGHIIKMFRRNSRPSWIKQGLGHSFMKYPQEYQIQFLTDIGGSYESNQHLPTLKPCICSSVETNFTPDNIWSAYNQGAPVSITLGLTFQEKELYMADDVEAEWPDEQKSEGGPLSNDQQTLKDLQSELNNI